VSAPRINRRAILAGAGATLFGTAFAARGANAALDIDAGDAGEAIVILQDNRHALPDAMRQLAGSKARLIGLEPDPVRQWRGEAAALLARRSTRLLGITRWPEFLMVRGLAEESGRRVRYQRFDAANGAMVWLIA